MNKLFSILLKGLGINIMLLLLCFTALFFGCDFFFRNNTPVGIFTSRSIGIWLVAIGVVLLLVLICRIIKGIIKLKGIGRKDSNVKSSLPDANIGSKFNPAEDEISNKILRLMKGVMWSGKILWEIIKQPTGELFSKRMVCSKKEHSSVGIVFNSLQSGSKPSQHCPICKESLSENDCVIERELAEGRLKEEVIKYRKVLGVK